MAGGGVGQDVVVYKMESWFAVACAPGDLVENEVEDEVNRQFPTNGPPRWQIASDAPGAPNPHGCEVDRGRKHWLLNC